MTLSMQEPGKAIFLQGKEGSPREFSGLYLAESIWLLRCQISRPILPESGPCVSLHLLSLANTFLGQSGIAHEEAGCGSVSEGAGCHTMFAWSRTQCTSKGPLVKSGRLPPCFGNPKAGSKASSVRRKKSTTGYIFRQLLGRTVIGIPGNKCEFWSLGLVSRWWHRLFPY